MKTSIVGYTLVLTVRGNVYEWSGDAKGLRLSNFKNELKGCGPFLHDDPTNRPTDAYGCSSTTL